MSVFINEQNVLHTRIVTSFFRFTYPSTNITLETVIKTGKNPAGLAIDSKFDHIYWTEIETNSIVRCNLNGKDRYTFPETIRKPFVIQLDLANRYAV